MRLSISVQIVMMLACGSVMAQEHEGRAIVVGAGYGVGVATADFSSIDGYEGFANGETAVTHAGVGIALPLGEESPFSLITRGAYVYTTALYSHDVPSYVLLPGDTIPVNVTDQRRLEYASSDIGIDLLVRYAPAGGLGFAAGVSAGIRSVGGWEMADHLTYSIWSSGWRPPVDAIPGDGYIWVLDDGSRRSFNTVSVGLLGSVMYSIPIDSRLALVPAIAARFDLLSPHIGTTARNISVGGDISLRFGF